jgi:hypothetical protein
MQVLCCGRGRRPQDGRTPATPVPQSPARPQRYKSWFHSPDTDFPMIPLDARQVPSLMATPRHELTMDPSLLEVEDSDIEVDNENHKSSATNTLGALKAKLGRRLSQRPDSVGHTQPSAGSSEEELARRAELRRLRQRRIREELETEEDSKSQSKEHGGCSQDTPRVQTGSDSGGPRDTTEFSISTIENGNIGAFLPSPTHQTEVLGLPIFTKTATSLSRSSSCPASTTPSRAPSREPSVNTESVPMVRQRQRGSLHQMPTPHLRPVHLSSITGSESMASWRLSYSASQLAELIGLTEEESSNKLPTLPNTSIPDSTDLDHPPKPLESKLSEVQFDKTDGGSDASVAASQASNTADPLDAHKTREKSEVAYLDKGEAELENSPESFFSSNNPDRYSPLDLWLRVSNTLQSIAHSSTRRNSDSMVDSCPTSLAADLSSVDKTQQLQAQTLTAGHALGTTLLKIPGAFPPHADPSESSSSRTAEVTRVQGASSTSQGWPEKHNSQEAPTRCIAEPSSPHDMTVTDISETSSYKTAPVKTLTPDMKILEAKHYGRSSLDSAGASDTASLKRIDIELESVAQRFSDTRTSRNQARSASSRFREEFDNPRVTNATKKPSLFSRLLHRREKESQSTLARQVQAREYHRNSLADAVDPQNLTSTGPNSDLAAEKQAPSAFANGKPELSPSATDVWQRAVRLEADRRQPPRRNPYGSRHVHRHSKHKSRSGDSYSQASGPYFHDRETSSLYSPSIRDSRSGVQSPKLQPVTGSENTEDNSGISLNTSNRILREWQHQIQSEELGSHRAPSFTTYIYATRKFNLIPASWAKWPSHTRAERNGSAGTKDSIEPKDFASAGVISDGHAKWSTDNEALIPHTNESQSIPPQPSLSRKLGHNIKSGLAKILPSRDDSARYEDDKKQPGEDGYLEYPELELLPNHGGYRELEALEQQIDKIKNPPSSSNGSRSGCPSGASVKTPLSLKLAREVHVAQNTEKEKAPDLSRLLTRTPSQLPNQSVGKLSTSHTKSGTPQQFGTPLTHVSYEDCVPTHMLDENDSNKSQVTIKRSKSNTENGLSERLRMSSTQNGRARSNSPSRKHVRECASNLERTTMERGCMDGGKDSMVVDVK